MGCVSSKDIQESRNHATPDRKDVTTSESTEKPAPDVAPTPAPQPAVVEPKQPPKEDENKPTPEPNEEPDAEEGEEEDSEISIYEGLEEKYTLGKEIGSGGYSVVLEATDNATNEKVAVKCIDLNAIETDTAGVDPLRPLKSEIKVMQKIDHPHIIKLYKVFIDEEGTKFYLVMELIPKGEELFNRITEKGCYTEAQASRIFRQLVSAVEYLHNLGIAHRDLKPENVLITGTGDNEFIKLADFGFAKHFKDEQMKTSLGSPAYAAPELFIAEFYNEKVDIWSLGVILYLLLSGEPPFYGATIRELTQRIVECDFDFNSSNWDNVSEAAKDLVCHMLVKDPAKRYSAKELKENLWVQGVNISK